MLVYAVKQFPPANYTVTCRFRLDRKVSHPAELFCAWCDDMDDPLRLFFKKRSALGLHGSTHIMLGPSPIRNARRRD